ncbi:MAG: hypothetical protein P4L10_00295 [Acidobacteriaceae bacterium]|nr:hypothetical protein [Acidobacteriaceae bacterium]
MVRHSPLIPVGLGLMMFLGTVGGASLVFADPTPALGADRPAGSSSADPLPSRRAAEIALIDRAREQGRIRVIVSLRLDQPGGKITPGDEAALLAEVPPGSVRVVSHFQSQQALVVEADTDGIRALLMDRRVARLEEDRRSRPLRSPSP